MPVVPQFQSEGDSGQAFNRGQDAGVSMMERAQMMHLRSAQEERQKALFDLTMPVAQAKQQADAAVAMNQLNEFQATQNLRQKYLPIINQARSDFHESQLIPDISQRAAANTQWLAKYAPIANLPEYQKEFQTYQHLATQTTQDQMKILHLVNANDMATAKMDALIKMRGMQDETSLQRTNLRNDQQDENNVVKKQLAETRAELDREKTRSTQGYKAMQDVIHTKRQLLSDKIKAGSITAEDAQKEFNSIYDLMGKAGNSNSLKADASSSSLSESDTQAAEWANNNPDDPRAAAIKKKLGL